MRSEVINDLEHVLIKCITACETCATKCLNEDNVKMMADCIKTDLDCAAICQLTSVYLARKSRFTKQTLRLCIEICKACEAECRKHEHEHCQHCAEICHECHIACEDYLGNLN